MTIRGTTGCASALLLLGLVLTPCASAWASNINGTLAADNSVYQLPFTVTGTQTYTFQTNSYASGGFVPVLTLFSSNGSPVGFDGGDGVCNGSEMRSSSTGICDDAFLQETLTSGMYTLDLTEFPNVAIGNLSDGFLFASDPTATGDVCGVPGGMFLESDLTPCVQRTNAFSLSVTNAAATPEPSSVLLMLPVAAVLAFTSRRSFS